MGYVRVARNHRSYRHHGEIDLIGWNHDVLCLIEVKTRTSRDVKHAEAAVDLENHRAAQHSLQSLPAADFRSCRRGGLMSLPVYYDPMA